MDQEIAWDLFGNLLDAAKVLGIDDEFTHRVAAARARLQGPRIAGDGRLMEWSEEFQELDPHHRHVSHLFALHPGHQISPETTPDLAAAARKTLEARGDAGTGWSLAWKVSFWARLRDGDRAHKLLLQLLRPVGRKEAGYFEGGGTLPNLFCSHPPMQMDGNFGGAAAIAEMLMQSRLEPSRVAGSLFRNQITLLPALPSAWPEGEARGLRARGGFTLDIKWKAGRLEQVRIASAHGGPCELHYGSQVRLLNVPAGTSLLLTDL
jgi:alpha-L-fucosidase 2